MNLASWWWRKSDRTERAAPRHGVSLVTTMRGEGGQRGSILIRDFSDDGFKAECLVRFRKGSDVVVDLPGGRTVEARVEWHRRNRVGVSFKQPFATSYLLSALGA